MGPAPMMRMERMSERFGMKSGARSEVRGGLLFLHQFHKAVEEIRHLPRARARFRVALEAVGGLVGELDALQRAVEERAMGGAHVRGERLLVNREAVVLARDEDLAGRQVLHGMVRAVVAELHLGG